MKRYISALAAVVMFWSTGCAPVLIGAIAYGAVKNKKARQEFLTGLQHTNMERESKGLKPLDRCREMYAFDTAWAARDKACKIKVREWRAKDKEADRLDRENRGLPPAEQTHNYKKGR